MNGPTFWAAVGSISACIAAVVAVLAYKHSRSTGAVPGNEGPRQLSSSPAVFRRQDAGASGGALRGRWDEVSFFQELQNQRGMEETDLAKRLYAWALEKGYKSEFGREGTAPPYYAPYWKNKRNGYSLTICSDGVLTMAFQYLKKHPAFLDPRKRLQIVDKLNRIPGFRVDAGRVDELLEIGRMRDLQDRGAYKQFLETLEWLTSEYNSSLH